MARTLSVKHTLSSNIFVNLFSWIFGTTEFARWETGQHSWQLRCTTFSAVVGQRLRERAHDANTPVVTLFVRGVPDDDHQFLLDCLDGIYQQLLEFKRSVTGDSSHDQGQTLETRRPVEQPVNASLEQVNAVLYPLLEKFSRVFLIVDDLDACGPSASQIVEEHLCMLQRRNVKIMVTSRITLHKTVYDSPLCDVCGQVAPVFWTCLLCQQGVHYVQICNDCKEQQCCCIHCGSRSHLVEPYARIELNTGNVGTEPLHEFISWELQKEHGDLGFALSPGLEWPPLSTLGASLISDHRETGNLSYKTLQYVSNRAQGNLTMTKLRLEDLREANNTEEIYTTRDRLPPNIVAFFDNLVAPIVTSSDPEGVVGLQAFKIISRTADMREIGTNEFRDQIRKSMPTEQVPHGFTLMQVLHATRGLLSLEIKLGDDESPIEPVVTAFHSDFHTYLKEAYNEIVAGARAG